MEHSKKLIIIKAVPTPIPASQMPPILPKMLDGVLARTQSYAPI